MSTSIASLVFERTNGHKGSQLRAFVAGKLIHVFDNSIVFMVAFNIFEYLPFIMVSTRHNASFVSYAYARFTTNRELIFCRISFSISTIDSPLRFLIRFFSSFLHAYILPVART